MNDLRGYAVEVEPTDKVRGSSPTREDAVAALTEADCLDLLRSCDVGRIAFELESVIEIFPVNYGVEGEIIIFRTDPGTKLTAVRNLAVSFEVDRWDRESGIGWSVVVKGRAEEITENPGRVAEHLRSVPVHPAAPGDRHHWIGIKPVEITGRRFHTAPASRAGA